MCGSVDVAEDLVADAISSAYALAAGIELRGAYSYMRVSVVNRYRDQMRRDARWNYAIAGPVAVVTIEDVAMRLDVSKALSNLPPEIRVVVVLRYLEDLSTSTVASILGRPDGSIRRMAHQGIRSLKLSGVLNTYLPGKGSTKQ